jgi:hypothetical protein
MPSVFVGQRGWLHRTIVINGPREPPKPPTLPVARSMRRHGKQPTPQIVAIAPRLEVLQELEERFLNDVLGVLRVPQHRGREAIDRCPMFLEQLLSLVTGL